MTTTSSGTTSKWIKGLIMLLGAAIIPVIITFFANGGHPTADNWLTVIKTAAGIFIMYMIKPAQTNQDPFGSVNWADFLHGLATVAGGFVVGTVIPALIHWPLASTDWWIIIGGAVSAFGTYILKALFTNSQGTVSVSTPSLK
jgi:hypothetical protein